MRSRIVILLSVLFVLGVSLVHAQTLQGDGRIPPAGGDPTLTVTVQPFDAEAPVGVRLGLIAEVVRGPVVLEQVTASAQLSVAETRLRSTAAVPLARATLVLTATRLAGGTPVRRTIPLTLSLAPGATQTFAVASVPTAELAAVWVPGETGTLEVAVIGATAAEGTSVFGDLRPPLCAT